MPESETESVTETDVGNTEAATQETADSQPDFNSRAFKQELLFRLPTLSVSKWETTETLNIYRDLQVILELDADAFLEPLKPIGEKNHDR